MQLEPSEERPKPGLHRLQYPLMHCPVAQLEHAESPSIHRLTDTHTHKHTGIRIHKHTHGTSMSQKMRGKGSTVSPEEECTCGLSQRSLQNKPNQHDDQNADTHPHFYNWYCFDGGALKNTPQASYLVFLARLFCGRLENEF